MNNSFSLIKLIGGLSKTLNVVNQLLPLYKQVKPYVGKAGQFLTNINNLPIPKQNFPQKINNQTNNNIPTFFQ